MSYYITDFNKIRQEKSIIKILESLERGFSRFGIDYYLIGAVAREVWMRGLKDITPRRATSDIDFGVLIKDSDHFDELKTYLVEIEGFTGYRENAFVLIAPGGRQIDILPFGEIEKEGKVTVKGTGMTTLLVDGMKEVYEEGIPEVTFEDKITFKVCTLPGIVLLKLIAWDDRPEMRRNDLTDIADILFHFFSIYDEMIWSEHNDLFGDERELETISARVLGREMGKILRRNENLKQR
nr:nucleotidyl transferase AbiEii/AbiGii toxin family protein [Cytophagales bacterium]